MITFVVPAITVAVRDAIADGETTVNARIRFLTAQGFSRADTARLMTAHSGTSVSYQRVNNVLTKGQD